MSLLTPGDPVTIAMPADFGQAADDDPRAYERNYRREAKRLGKDLPIFYFSLTNAAVPDTLHRITIKAHREAQRDVLQTNGNWPLLQYFYQQVKERSWRTDDDLSVSTARIILLQRDPNRIADKVNSLPPDDPIRLAWESFQTQPKRHLLWLPRLHWYGSNNQYHHWLTGIIRGDFGISTLDRRPVVEKMWPALQWTALMNSIAILFAYLIAIPLGLYTAYYAGSRFDTITTILLFLLFSLPSFWLATMLNNFITTPNYGMDWFPTMGVGEVTPNMNWGEYLLLRGHHLFLPIFCLTYPALAFLTRQMRNATKAELAKAYVTTARLKGLTVHQILWKHVFRNAMFPIITLLAGLLPSILAGSVLIEIIFYLPGMGRLLVDSVLADDWPVVLAILILNGLLTVIGILLADVLYVIADPRVKLGNAKAVTN
ncbi:MAG: ABC transporter permease [Bacteroidota bacterium]